VIATAIANRVTTVTNIRKRFIDPILLVDGMIIPANFVQQG